MVDGKRMNLALNRELLEEVQCFKYLGSHVAVGGGIEGNLNLILIKLLRWAILT